MIDAAKDREAQRVLDRLRLGRPTHSTKERRMIATLGAEVIENEARLKDCEARIARLRDKLRSAIPADAVAPSVEQAARILGVTTDQLELWEDNDDDFPDCCDDRYPVGEIRDWLKRREINNLPALRRSLRNQSDRLQQLQRRLERLAGGEALDDEADDAEEPEQEPLLVSSSKEAAELLCVSLPGFLKWEREPDFPDFSAGYPIDKIRDWLHDRKERTDSEAQTLQSLKALRQEVELKRVKRRRLELQLEQLQQATATVDEPVPMTPDDSSVKSVLERQSALLDKLERRMDRVQGAIPRQFFQKLRPVRRYKRDVESDASIHDEERIVQPRELEPGEMLGTVDRLPEGSPVKSVQPAFADVLCTAGCTWLKEMLVVNEQRLRSDAARAAVDIAKHGEQPGNSSCCREHVIAREAEANLLREILAAIPVHCDIPIVPLVPRPLATTLR